MKKPISLFMVVVSAIFMLSACGGSGQGSENDFSGIIRDINLTMTKDDVIKMEYNLSGVNYTWEEIYKGDTVLYYEDVDINGYSGKLIYRIEESDTLGFLQFEFDKNEDYDSFMAAFQARFGEPSKKERYYVVWHGLIDGVKASFTASEDMSMVEIARK